MSSITGSEMTVRILRRYGARRVVKPREVFMLGRLRLGSALLAVAWVAATTTTSAGCGPDGSSPGHDAAVADASEPDDDGGDDVADAAPADANVDAGPSTDFFTSFEPDEPALTWQNTVETDPSGAKLISGISG